MAQFDDLYTWVDQEDDGYIHMVHAAFATVYDKANIESTESPSADFSACGQGVFSLVDGVLEAVFTVTFSDRIQLSSATNSSTTGQRNIWRIRLSRDGNIDIFQTGWTTQYVRLTNVDRLDTAGAQFAIGHLSDGRTKSLLSFSFDKVKAPTLL